jgi:hypothetical protein
VDIENVSLTEVIAAARTRHASLVPESAGYLLLGVMRAVGGRPVRIVPSQVMLNTEGVVTLIGPREPLRASEAAAIMVTILGDLLDVSQGKATALRAVIEAPEPKMDRVFTGVTKALIPINRAAAKRALARLARETVRAKERGQLRPEDLHEAPVERVAASEPAPAASWDALRTDIEIVTPTPAPPRPRIAMTLTGESKRPERLEEIPQVVVEPEPSDEPAEVPEATEVDGVVAVEVDEAPASNPVMEPPATPESQLEPSATPFAVTPLAELSAAAISEDPDEAARSELADDESAGEAKECASRGDETTSEAEPQDAIASETALAERLAHGTVVVDCREAGQVERLLEGFGADGDDAVDEAVQSLERLVEPTPMPGIVTGARRRATLSIEDDAFRSRRAPTRIARPSRKEPAARKPVRTLAGVAAAGQNPPATEDKKPVSMPRRGPCSTRDRELPFAPLVETPSMGVACGPRDHALPFAPLGSTSASVSPASTSTPGQPAPAGGDATSATPPSACVESSSESAPAVERLSVELSDSLAPQVETIAARQADASDANDTEPDDAVLSLSPPMVAVDERLTPDVRSMRDSKRPGRGRRQVALAAFGFALSVIVAVAVVGLRRPELRAAIEDRVRALTRPEPATGSSGVCLAELRLKDLPRPHEVLLRLGDAPATAVLPTGVRLELVAIAADRLPERLVLGPDAAWTEGLEGPELWLEVALERQEGAHWPAAPAGDVGGVGPRGRVHVAASGSPAEIWLVVGAGAESERVIEIPCGEGATLLALNPDDPREQRRLHIAPRLLETAAEAGGADISLRP